MEEQKGNVSAAREIYNRGVSDGNMYMLYVCDRCMYMDMYVGTGMYM